MQIPEQTPTTTVLLDPFLFFQLGLASQIFVNHGCSSSRDSWVYPFHYFCSLYLSHHMTWTHGVMHTLCWRSDSWMLLDKWLGYFLSIFCVVILYVCPNSKGCRRILCWYFFSVSILHASETKSFRFVVVFFQKETLSLYTLRVYLKSQSANHKLEALSSDRCNPKCI